MANTLQKSIRIPFLDIQDTPLQFVPEIFKKNDVTYHSVTVVNWKDFPYLPTTQFAMVYSSNKIILHFKVEEDEVRGFVTEDFGPVSTDSCVEFFACMGQDDLYYNIECNCLGYITMAVRKNRNEKEYASPEIVQDIKRYTTFGSQFIGDIKEKCLWNCVLEIPLTAFFRHNITNVKGQLIRANFYKCGGSDEYKHYVTWNPVVSEMPDFHRPECFGTIQFD